MKPYEQVEWVVAEVMRWVVVVVVVVIELVEGLVKGLPGQGRGCLIEKWEGVFPGRVQRENRTTGSKGDNQAKATQCTADRR